MPNKYTKLHNSGLNVPSISGSIYIWECVFLQMKMLKSKKSNKLSQVPLRPSPRIMATEMKAQRVKAIWISTMPNFLIEPKVITHN